MSDDNFITSIFKNTTSNTDNQRSVLIEDLDSKNESIEEKTKESNVNDNQSQSTMLEMMITAQAEANKLNKEVKLKSEQKTAKEFGNGFKKGFFGASGDNSKSKSQPAASKTINTTSQSDSSIITVKPTKSTESNLVIESVQEAMSSSENPLVNQLQKGG